MLEARKNFKSLNSVLDKELTVEQLLKRKNSIARRRGILSEKADEERFKKELNDFAVCIPEMDFMPSFRVFINLMQKGLEPDKINDRVKLLELDKLGKEASKLT